ncbi:MAG TPA: hypothetical protein VI462_11970 [Acidimicrobiia bacterium]
MKRLLVVVAAAGLLTLGSAGVAAAQTSGGSTTNPTSPHSSTSPKGQKGRVVVGVLRVSAQTLAITPRDLVNGLCSGQTLAQVASAHGKTSQDLINALIQKADQRVQANEKAGKITQAQETTREAKVKDKVTKLVTSYQVPMQRCQRLQGGGAGATTPATGSST